MSGDCGLYGLCRLVKKRISGQEYLTTPMRQETQRCQLAFEEAAKGKEVAMGNAVGMPGYMAWLVGCIRKYWSGIPECRDRGGSWRDSGIVRWCSTRCAI